MPHIKLEHTKRLETKKLIILFSEIVKVLKEFTSIKSENCKYKAYKINNYLIDKDHSNNFYHLEITLLKGKNNEIIKKISKKTLKILQKYFKNKNKEQFSVEIREVNKNNYTTTNRL